ncbi:endo alpha-1,4 polygalactosaminidase [Tenacibaculum sp. TC6]|uniref:endo alpha-1,4 polygalactosaminidase n=1 Tax=Tenacibaculum sp. TC6 TaxID=3423223 RepID=UPI003D369580
MLHFKYLIVLAGIIFSTKLTANSKNVFLCYGKVPVHEIINYEYVILEASHYSASEVAVLKQNNKLVLCYLSLGEFNTYTSFYEGAKNYALSGKNTIWNSYYLDLSQKPVHEILLNDIKQKVIMNGFDGLFLDNVDNYCTYGKQKHQQNEFLKLLHSIKNQFPSIYLMQNAGLEIVEHTHQYINSIAIESIVTNYNFDDKEYRFRDKKECNQKVCQLKTIEEKYNIPLIIIEYANRKRDYNKISRKLRKYKWNIFIGQIDLQNKPSFK